MEPEDRRPIKYNAHRTHKEISTTGKNIKCEKQQKMNEEQLLIVPQNKNKDFLQTQS